MRTIGIIGAGEVGSQIARAAIATGYEVVIANSRGPLTLAVSSDSPEAVELVTRLYDEFGFDAVDNSPLSESWRSAPNTPMWRHIVEGQTREQLVRNLAAARRAPGHPKGRHAVGPTADGGAPAGA